MRNEGKQKEKPTTGKSRKVKIPDNAGPHSSRLQQEDEHRRLTEEDACSVVKRVITEEEFRARVSRKAYELYEKRQAITHVEDWLEGERLVKAELLAEGQWAGTV
ncbi:MAG TPA: hypothetical protein VFG71_08520 [Nitrospiraceae bacterium]|nr:hypothetical protein [Nitrospiraceae bacterium]